MLSLLIGTGLLTAIAIWIFLAYQLAGKGAAFFMGLLGLVGSVSFLQAEWIGSVQIRLIVAGILFNIAAFLATKEERVGPKGLAVVGAGLGVCWPSFWFAVMHVTPALLLYSARTSEYQRARLFPTRRETERGLSKLWSLVIMCGALASVISFFKSDQFFGINAESNLKLTVFLTLGFWFKHRWALVLHYPRNVLSLFAGLAVGLAPWLIYQTSVLPLDSESLGLARWSDLKPLVDTIPNTLATALNNAHPGTLGLVTLGSFSVVLALGLGTQDRRFFRGVLGMVLFALVAWLTIRTPAYLQAEQLLPFLFTIYLATSTLAFKTKFKKLALVFLSLGGILTASGLL